MRWDQFQLAALQLAQGTEGHVHEHPVAVVAVVVARQIDGRHRHVALQGGAVDPGLEGLKGLRCVRALDCCSLGHGLLVSTLESPVNASGRIGSSKVVRQRHVGSAPPAGHVLLHSLRELGFPGHGHPEALQGTPCKALRKPLHGQLQDHLRFQRVIVREDPACDGIVAACVGQPLGREAVRELGHVARHVFEQHATAVCHLHVHMALQAGQQILDVATHAFRIAGRIEATEI